MTLRVTVNRRLLPKGKKLSDIRKLVKALGIAESHYTDYIGDEGPKILVFGGQMKGQPCVVVYDD